MQQKLLVTNFGCDAVQDQLRDLWERASRLVGWGVVALIHLLMWQVLSRGLNVFTLPPKLTSMEVALLEQDPLPLAAPPQPQQPKVDVAALADMYVPTPEVNVVRESAPRMTTASVTPVAVAPEPTPAAVPALSSAQLMVISDSEVDYVVRPEIRYPLAAKRAKEYGTVLLSVIVDERGMVKSVSIFKSSGYHRLDEVAVRALRALRVKPYIRNGLAQAVEIRVPVEFSLGSAV